ncbi:MAG: SocA family protein [Erythrobacter sp.]|nr:SocA family protein [Erythrobacter sp.]
MANEKLKEALHYVIECCDDSSRLGAVRLNKILWFADCHSYRDHGTSITTDGYVKRRFGPVPKRVLAATRELEEEGKIAIREVPYSSRKSFREFISLKQPDHHALSEQDLEILHAYTQIICNEFSAARISELSHDQIWEAADEGEEIPLFTIFASIPGAITNDVRKWANEVALKVAA